MGVACDGLADPRAMVAEQISGGVLTHQPFLHGAADELADVFDGPPLGITEVALAHRPTGELRQPALSVGQIDEPRRVRWTLGALVT